MLLCQRIHSTDNFFLRQETLLQSIVKEKLMYENITHVRLEGIIHRWFSLTLSLNRMLLCQRTHSTDNFFAAGNAAAVNNNKKSYCMRLYGT